MSDRKDLPHINGHSTSHKSPTPQIPEASISRPVESNEHEPEPNPLADPIAASPASPAPPTVTSTPLTGITDLPVDLIVDPVAELPIPPSLSSPPADPTMPEPDLPVSTTTQPRSAAPTVVLSRWTGKPSVRKDPHSRANLLPELDKIFPGDPARTIDEDEHRIWLVREEKELTDATRFFASVWCRFIQEHGTIPHINQEEYLDRFFLQYGPLLHRAEAGRTVLQHLLRLYRYRHLHAPLYGRRDRDPESVFMKQRQKAACDSWLRLTRRWNELIAEWNRPKPSIEAT